MTRLQAAAKLIKISGYADLTRASLLDNDPKEALIYILEMQKEVNTLCDMIVTNDETKIYVAK